MGYAATLRLTFGTLPTNRGHSVGNSRGRLRGAIRRESPEGDGHRWIVAKHGDRVLPSWTGVPVPVQWGGGGGLHARRRQRVWVVLLRTGQMFWRIAAVGVCTPETPAFYRSP